MARASSSTPTALSRDQIIAAGVRIADDEGLAAVSMRRVAGELGAGVMSLYRHVRDKDELLVAMTETIIATAPYPEPQPPTWRESAQVAAKLDWEIYREHPWMVLTLTSPRYYADPHCLDWMIHALRPLTTDSALARSLTLTLWAFVQGMSLHRIDDDSTTVATYDGANIFTPTDEDFTLGLEAVLDGMERTSQRQRS